MSKHSATGIGASILAQIPAFVPDWVRAVFAGYPLARSVEFVSGGLAASRRRMPVSHLTTDNSGKAKRGKRRIDIIAPPDLFLKRTIRIPKAARSKLVARAELDLRQSTPFAADEVYWQLGTPVQADDFVTATQWVVKRADIEKWRARLAAQGFQVRKVFVKGATGAGPIADFSDQLVPWRRGVMWLNGSLAALAVAAACTGWLYPAWVAQQQTQIMQAQLEDLQAQAVALRRTVETQRSEDAERTAFLDAILRRALLVDTVRELTVALPDEVWISALAYTPERIVMNGETAGSAAELVLQLGSRRGFGNPRLSGPVQRTSNNHERFEITVDLGRRR